MPEVLPHVFAPSHVTDTMSTLDEPWRWWPQCRNTACGWAGGRWRSAVLAEAEGRMHRLANCEHPGTEWTAGGPQVCTVCGVQVILDKSAGRLVILTDPDA